MQSPAFPDTYHGISPHQDTGVCEILAPPSELIYVIHFDTHEEDLLFLGQPTDPNTHFYSYGGLFAVPPLALYASTMRWAESSLSFGRLSHGGWRMCFTSGAKLGS